MLKPTPTNLKKLEELFKQAGYKIIYEKGHFQSGYCIVNTQNTIVVNKFYKVDARVRCLLIILNELEFDTAGFDEDTLTFYQSCLSDEA